MSHLPKSKRIAGDVRAELATSLKDQYERGVSIRALADETGRSFGFVYALLLESGAAMRPRGGPSPGARPADRA